MTDIRQDQDQRPLAVTILLVEDDPGHAVLIENNLRSGGIYNDIVKVRDGQQALDYLFNRGQFANKPRPTALLMLLDLHLPGIDGIEVLEAVKADPKLRSLPVVVLTSTDDPAEIKRCYELGCSLYIPKPVEYQNFASVVRELGLLMVVTAVPASG